nr:hypothetical protein [Tanacetum cinerariifolium]
MGKALDVSLVVTKSSETDSKKQDTSSRSGNDADADNADIRPIYDEEPMAKVQLTVECNIFATGQQHTDQLEITTKGQHGQILNETSNNAKIKKEIDVLETMNIELEHIVAKLLKENETFKRKLKGNNVDTKFAKTSVLGKPVSQSLRNNSLVRQPNAFKSERPQMSKPRFSSQVDVNNNLSKPITQHYLPKRSESAFLKPNHMIASNSSRNSSMNMPRFSSNDMVHNHYLNEARKKTKDIDRNSKTSVMHAARFQSTIDDSKPKTRSTNHSTRSLPTSNVYEKTSPRSDLRWKPTGRIFKIVGLRWVPTGKMLASCTSKDDSKPTHGSNVDITNINECKQCLDLSAGTSINVKKERSFDLSAGTCNNVKEDNLRVWLLKKLISQKPVLKWIQN